MKNLISKRFFAALGLTAILSLAVVTPAAAFTNREGDKIVIGADEVIDDDLYVFSDSFTLDGTVKGDVISFGQSTVINGTVEGDLIAAGSEVIINGTVADDVRIAGGVLYVGAKGKIGDDLIVAGGSFETQPGSIVGGDVIFGGGQGLLAGDVTGNVRAGTSGLDLRGNVGGDVDAYVDYDKESAGSPPMSTIMQTGGQQYSVSIPQVAYGLTVSKDAKIDGSLKYTSNVELPVPAEAVGGKITRLDLPKSEVTVQQPTPAQMAGTWALGLLRKTVTLILVGLLLAWLAPALLKGAGEKIQSKALPSLGWGLVAYAAFFFVLLLLFVVMILGAVIFGMITLGGVSTAIVFASLLSIAVLILTFVLTTSWLAPVIAGSLIGKWIFRLFKSDLAEHRIWPMLVGVVIVTPFILAPLGVGFIASAVVIFFALGALWLMARDRLQKQPEVQV